MSDKNKRKCIGLETDLAILNDVDKKIKKSLVAQKYDIPASTLSTIIKDREKIEDANTKTVLSSKRKYVRASIHEDVEEALFTWFKDVRARNIAVSGPLLKAKAATFATIFGKRFLPGNGWLHRFKQRYNIVFKTMAGESEAVDDETIQQWLAQNKEAIQAYEPRDVYNVDETGLFFQMMPSKTMALKGIVCHGGKLLKQRITVTCITNIDGSDKRKLHVIGKSKKPRAFKKVKHMPVDYHHNTKAWMTKAMFLEWLLDFDKSMANKRRKVLLIMDNCTAHCVGPNLRATTLLFLPPNTTAKIQPLDQGIIAAMKTKYKARMIERILINIRMERRLTVNIWESIQMINGEWGNVTQSTIPNCWWHSGLTYEDDHEDEQDAVADDPDIIEDQPSAVNDVWTALGNEVENVTFAEFVAADDELITCEPDTDATIVESVIGNDASDSDSDAASDVGDDEQIAIPTTSQVLNWLALTHVHMDAHGLSKDAIGPKLQLESLLIKNSLKVTVQKKLTDYFKK